MSFNPEPESTAPAGIACASAYGLNEESPIGMQGPINTKGTKDTKKQAEWSEWHRQIKILLPSHLCALGVLRV